MDQHWKSFFDSQAAEAAGLSGGAFLILGIIKEIAREPRAPKENIARINYLLEAYDHARHQKRA